MDLDRFVAYLDDRGITFDRVEITAGNHKFLKVIPDHFRLKERVFKFEGEQVVDFKEDDNSMGMTISGLVKVIDDKISNMSTKGVYHPRRLQPKWESLNSDQEKIKLFKRYMGTKNSSIGFLRLVSQNLCHKTLESIVIEYVEVETLLNMHGLRQKCIDRFKKYQHGKEYLKNKLG